MSELNKHRILLVEDDLNVAKLFEYNLTKAGYECIHANNGAEGLALAIKKTPDLILSDIMMPEVDGYQFRENILANEKLKDIPFVFLTAKGEEEDILRGYELGVEEYVIKTSSPKIVLAKIGAILKTKEKQRQKAIEEVHTAAEKMGAKVVPDAAPEFIGFEINHWHSTFENVPGGDFIDYIKINDQNLVIVLGDIMGKKWGAWYFAVAYAGYVRSAVRFALSNNSDYSPGKIISKVNEAVYEDERISDVFITLSVITLNNVENVAKYSGAGDLPLIYKGKKVHEYKSNGLLLGFDNDSEYDDIEIKLNKGDELFITTDGLVDSRNNDGEAYGIERLKDFISKLDHSVNSIDAIKEDYVKFTGNRADDDISIIGIKVT